MATTDYFINRSNAFRNKKLRNLGSDLGGALKGFKTAMKDDEAEAGSEETDEAAGETIEATAEKVETKEAS